jgi:hypothetical protein
MVYKTANNTENEYAVRIPLDMFQYTESDGKTWPVAFKWPDVDGVITEVRIDRIISVTTLAEQKSGTVGDRYECDIEGNIVYIYYTKLAPRKWFKIVPCNELDYKSYYRLRGENESKVAENEQRYGTRSSGIV